MGPTAPTEVAGAPALRLQSFPIQFPDGILELARDELLDRTTPDRSAGFRWGYLLGVEEAARQELPHARRLSFLLREAVVAPIERQTGRRYSLSFLKTSAGPPPPAREGVHYGGLHLDTHPNVNGRGDRELARVLLNLAETPRRLRFAAVDRFELAKRGVDVPRDDYQVVDLPPGVPTETIEIPACSGDSIHGMRFWASVVPHVGVDDAHGHFLASYEAVAERRAP